MLLPFNIKVHFFDFIDIFFQFRSNSSKEMNNSMEKSGSTSNYIDNMKSFIKCFLLMKKRISKRQEYFETIHQQNYSIAGNSPTKTKLMRQNTVTHFRKERHIFQLPKIFPIHNIIKQKRYLESCLGDTDTSLNLVGTKFMRKMSRQKRNLENPIQPPEFKVERPLVEKEESQKHIFLDEVMAYNGIGSITMQKKEKLKVFIDQGNNSRLVNQLMRRRPNLKIVSSKKDANIVWTQFCDWQQANLGSYFVQSDKTIRQRQRTYLYSEKLQNYNDSKIQEVISPKTYRMKELVIQELRMHNHLKNHYQISDKKCLFKNIKRYCKTQKINEHQIIPKTYHIDGNQEDLPQNICEKQSIWIIKPGEDTNRGTGITVQQGRSNIVKAIKQLATFGKSSLVQEYIDPLLYKNRKFDIRCYALVTSMCGNIKAYWYKQGYLRTCCKEFSYDPSNIFGHLTNDAVQKKHKDYGKYEPCNKLSFSDLEVFLKTKQISYEQTVDRMKQLALISIKSAEDKLKGDKNIFSFQIFGYDFLIDSKGKVWLIEINTNPCLEFSGSLLSRIIWHMVQNSLAIAIDPFLKNLPQGYNSLRDKIEKIYEDNKFQCII